ncbi:MAG: THUMP domain-containing protein [Myxococcales bacterium]|nr:THUMP domain-containing protein [Myxococcota bacterium]MDW8280865.1 THUMP domain-containing protein [Myxococcales bacterium]
MHPAGPHPLFPHPGAAARLVALCPAGAEGVCAAEVAALPSVRSVRPGRGAVTFWGTREVLYRANLHLRTPSRILGLLSDAPCDGPQALYAQARALPWEAYLQPRGTLAVSARGVLPSLRNTMFTAQRVKDAICDRFREQSGLRPDVHPEDPDVRVNVQLYTMGGQGRCALALDSSGEALHRRGYRVPGTAAPMKETLAAAILLLSGYAGGPLVDPLCGGGTLLIEGGLLALGRAPGLGRRFGFQRWLDFDEALWERLVQEATAAARRPAGPFLFGSDIDPRALAAAEQAARSAGLAEAMRLQALDVRALVPPAGPPGLLVCNPPYGERMGREPELRSLYRALGEVLQERFSGYRACIYSANRALVRQIGLQPRCRHVLPNGGLPGQLLCFELA